MAGRGHEPAGAGGSSGREGAARLAVLTPAGGLPAVPALARAAVGHPCTCGHGPAEHEHFRAGTDCGACGGSVCSRLRPARGRARRGLRGWIRRTAGTPA
jgi:hypothetical protein